MYVDYDCASMSAGRVGVYKKRCKGSGYSQSHPLSRRMSTSHSSKHPKHPCPSFPKLWQPGHAQREPIHPLRTCDRAAPSEFRFPLTSYPAPRSNNRRGHRRGVARRGAPKCARW